MEDNKIAPKKTKAPETAEMSGHVAGLSAGSEDAPYRFEVEVKKGRSRTFVLDTTNAARFGAMSAMVMAAFAAGKKLHVRGTANGASPMVATELRLGQKGKAPKVAKAKPRKSVTVETAATPAP